MGAEADICSGSWQLSSTLEGTKSEQCWGGGGVSAPWELCPGLYDCLVSLVSPLPKWDSLTGDIILRSFTAALVLLLCSWLSVGQPKYAS